MNRSRLWNLFKIVLAFGLAGYIFSQTQLGDLIALEQRISVPWLLVSMVIFASMIPAMALRYWALMDGMVSFRQILMIVVIQTIVGNLLATSAGAVSFVGLLRSKHQIGIRQSVGSILLARFGDLLILFCILALASWVLWLEILPLQGLILAVLASVALLLVGLLIIFVRRQRAIGVLDSVLTRLGWRSWTRVDRWFNQLFALSEYDPRQMWIQLAFLLGYTILFWLLQIAFGIANLEVFSIPISVWQMIWIIAFTQLIAIVPIQILGGLGVYDITSMYLYSSFGVRQELVTSIVVAARIYFYLLNIWLMPYWIVGESFHLGKRIGAK